METVVLEVVIFSLTNGTNRDGFVAAADASMEWAREQPGFVSRELFETSGGQWIDTVRWASMEAAQAAAGGIGDAEQTRGFVSMIDGTSVQILHATPVTSIR
jgi:hypothetical protein